MEPIQQRLRRPEQQRWYEEVKRELLRTEPLNIAARASACASLINETIPEINALLRLPMLSDAQRFETSVRGKEAIYEHLPFLLRWPGLRTDASPKAAKTLKDYEKKAKNWLKGRRAPNYAKTLFPQFVRDAKQYAHSLAAQLIPGHGDAPTAKRKLYEDIVVYHVLEKLCGCRISLRQQSKNSVESRPLFCKNSVEKKGNLRLVLQEHASDHEYVHGFPSCAAEAVGFFRVCSFLKLHRKSQSCFRLPDTEKVRQAVPYVPEALSSDQRPSLCDAARCGWQVCRVLEETVLAAGE